MVSLQSISHLQCHEWNDEKCKGNDRFDLVKEKEMDENGLQANHSCGPQANPTRVNNDLFFNNVLGSC